MPKLGTSQRTSALVRLFEESRGRGLSVEPAALTRCSVTSTSGTDSCDISQPEPPLLQLTSANSDCCANMVFNYSDYHQQVVSAGVTTGKAATADVGKTSAAAVVTGTGNSTGGVAAERLKPDGGILQDQGTGTSTKLDTMGKGLTNGHGRPGAPPPPPPKPPSRPMSNGVITNGQHRPSLKTKDKPPKVLKKPQREPVKLFHMNGFSQEGHIAMDEINCTFVGSRNVLDADTLREHKIVSNKGTVRGFKNRVRAGITTFNDQEQLMVSIFSRMNSFH